MVFSVAPKFVVHRLRRESFEDAGQRMQSLVGERADGGDTDHLLMHEFDPLLTVGRGESLDRYQGLGLPVHEVERGGKTTFHGPGQLVAYPVIGLEETGRDTHAYLYALEEALILTVADFGLTGKRDDRNTGCWVGGRKIASIGIAVRRWVAWHGVALNVSTDLDWFRRFDPCGLEPETMTTLENEMGTAPPLAEVAEVLATRLRFVLRGQESSAASK